jgi:hypothetical protein
VSKPEISSKSILRMDIPILLMDIDDTIIVPSPINPNTPHEQLHINGLFTLDMVPNIAQQLKELEEYFEIVWCTGWNQAANSLMAESLGLEPYPWIDLSKVPFTIEGTWKLEAVISYIGDRPVAWIDDILDEDAYNWASNRESPTFLVKPDYYQGMTRDQVDELINWAKELRSA